MILLEWCLVLGPSSCTPSSEYLREVEILLQSQFQTRQLHSCQTRLSYKSQFVSCELVELAQWSVVMCLNMRRLLNKLFFLEVIKTKLRNF